MVIKFHCECGQHFQVDQQHAGKRATCNACGRKLTIPLASEAPASPAGNGAAVASKPAAAHAAAQPAAPSAADIQAQELLVSAKEHEEDGYHHRAIEDLHVIVATPGVSRALKEQAWLLMGKAKLDTADYPGAIDALCKSSTAGEGEFTVPLWRGIARLRTGDLEGAKKDLGVVANSPKIAASKDSKLAEYARQATVELREVDRRLEAMAR
jgi:hypothetical protein